MRVDEILVARRQFAAQQVLKYSMTCGFALHGGFLFGVHEAEGSGSSIAPNALTNGMTLRDRPCIS